MKKHVLVTGAAAISYSFTPAQACHVITARLHLNGVGVAGDLTITLNSGQGEVYDVVYRTIDMTLVKNMVWTSEGDGGYLVPGDTLDFAWANGSTKIYGLEILYR